MEMSENQIFISVSCNKKNDKRNFQISKIGLS